MNMMARRGEHSFLRGDRRIVGQGEENAKWREMSERPGRIPPEPGRGPEPDLANVEICFAHGIRSENRAYWPAKLKRRAIPRSGGIPRSDEKRELAAGKSRRDFVSVGSVP